ncbi:YitT family protein [Bifidobacterium sp. 64T4]|nr:YitT family protein [Bifidobacterium pongonis]
MVVNSFAIALITKGDMGTSQISSVPYVLSLRFPLSFGVMTFILNMLFIVLQIVLLRRDFRPVQLLQIVVNLLFSAMIDVSMSLLSFLNPTMLWQRLACIVAGCCVMGFGIVIEVCPNVLMVPGEGVVRALSVVSHAKYGTTKIVFDITLIAIAVVLSFALFGELRGVGLGTVISALCVGSVINGINRTFSFPERIRSLALVTDRDR